jgi:hypothetical protein
MDFGRSNIARRKIINKKADTKSTLTNRLCYNARYA